MNTWLTFLVYSAGRPDTWLSLAGAAITIVGIVLQQHVLFSLMRSAELQAEEKARHEQRYREIRDRQREAADLRKMSEIEQLIIEVRREAGNESPPAPARLEGLIEACTTLYSACEIEDDAAIEAFYDRQQKFIERAYASDPLLYLELSGVHIEVSRMADEQANDALHKSALATIAHAQIDLKIRRVASLGAILSAAGFVLVLLAGTLGAQLGDFFSAR